MCNIMEFVDRMKCKINSNKECDYPIPGHCETCEKCTKKYELF